MERSAVIRAGFEAHSGKLSSHVISLEVVTVFFFVAELFIVLASAWISKLTYINLWVDPNQALRPYMGLAGVGAFASLASSSALGLYAPQMLLNRNAISRVAAAQFLAFAGILFVLFALHVSEVYSRGWFFCWLVLSVVSICFWRLLARGYLRRLVKYGSINRRIAVFGTREAVDAIGPDFWARNEDVTVVARYMLSSPSAASEEVDAMARELVELGRTGRYDQIVVAIQMEQNKLFLDALRGMAILPIDIILLPIMTHFGLPSSTLTEFRGLAAIELQRAPLSESQRIIKATFDVTVSACALVVLLPVFAVIAAAIKIDSRGPIFFRQRRHGYNDCVFKVWKFRTMTVLEDGAELIQARRNDHRVTRLGRFLRSTSLDELPQLLNVLKGDMSFVGPRPHAIAHNVFYSQLWADYSLRHRVKPGITGLAQINGFRGETTDPNQMIERARFDIEYTRNWSILGDIKILLQTIVCLSRQNAY